MRGVVAHWLPAASVQKADRPAFAQVAAAWQHLPEAVKADILTMVTASHGQ